MASFSGYPNKEYLFVGTVIENADDPDASHGRILVFDIKENYKIELLEAIDEPGIIYDMRAFQNSVVACVNGSVSGVSGVLCSSCSLSVIDILPDQVCARLTARPAGDL